MIIIKDVQLSTNTVKKGETFKVTVVVEEKVGEPLAYRLPFKLNSPKGGIR